MTPLAWALVGYVVLCVALLLYELHRAPHREDWD